MNRIYNCNAESAQAAINAVGLGLMERDHGLVLTSMKAERVDVQQWEVTAAFRKGLRWLSGYCGRPPVIPTGE